MNLVITFLLSASMVLNQSAYSTRFAERIMEQILVIDTSFDTIAIYQEQLLIAREAAIEDLWLVNLGVLLYADPEFAFYEGETQRRIVADTVGLPQEMGEALRLNLADKILSRLSVTVENLGRE